MTDEHSLRPKTSPTIDGDTPVSAEEHDHYGFVQIAEKLAPTILSSAHESGFVIGIEGPWGSGKSTLLSFIKQQIEANAADTSVIEVAPWLLGDIAELPRELFSQVKSRVSEIDTRPTPKRQQVKDAAQGLAQTLDRYSAVTSTAASALEFIGQFNAPTNTAAKLMKRAISAAKQHAGGPSAIELKRSIETALTRLEHTFVVLIDDLDRLEPNQATEVLRLVKSVANLPNLTFVMCYDRHVLSIAVEKNLGVDDGSAFIQKIVQVSYGMPLYEPFALRTQLKIALDQLRSDLGLPNLEPEEASDYRQAIDQHGSTLTTPREVKAVLNRIKLLYPPIQRDVYFPDFVRIQLIKVLKPALYDWIEEYLNERSVIENGDGQVSGADHQKMGERLQELLPYDGFDSGNSIYAISGFIPGIERDDDPKKAVYVNTGMEKSRELAKRKRLGSPFHYKFYFALSAPTTVLADDEIDELIQLAAASPEDLASRLKQMSHSERMHGQSWLVHAVQRMQTVVAEHADDRVAQNTVIAFAEVIDDATRSGMNRHFMMRDITRAQVRDMTDILLKRLSDSQPDVRKAFWQRLLATKSLSWLVADFLRKHLHDNGLVGDRAVHADARVVTPKELTLAKRTLRERLENEETRSSLESLPELGSFMYGWRELCGTKMARQWAKQLLDDPERLVTFLLGLRSLVIADRVLRPLYLSTIKHFLPWTRVEAKLEAIETDDAASAQLKTGVAEVRAALTLSEAA